MVCPGCNSKMIKRKKRSLIKKILLFKPEYKCGVCKISFKKNRKQFVIKEKKSVYITS